MVNFMIDLNGEGTQLKHYWEKCVGSCHAYTGLREDWRIQIKKCHDELGFQYVRFHGLLDDNMSVYSKIKSLASGKEEIRYSFYNIDSIFDYLIKIGMKPFIELGFMPKAMASGEETCFHYSSNVTPPSDYSEWEKLIGELTAHLVKRYGVEEVRTWYFEVWNEPNLQFFWAGTKEEYFKLYKHSARAIKNVDNQLRVGGPATSINAWIPDMIEFCKKTDTPIDFISTHHYPTDDPLWKNSDMDMEEFFKIAGKYDRGILTKMAKKARTEAGELPLLYTEWNCSAILPDVVHDEPYAAALVAKTIADNDQIVDAYSFWTFTDIFEEAPMSSVPFHGGFGLQTIQGIPKPTYRTFEILHQLGDRRLKVTGNGNASETVDILASRNNQEIVIMITNHNIPDAPISEENVSMMFKGSINSNEASIARIDELHANAKRKWIELGSPEYPDANQINEMVKASELKWDKLVILKKENEHEVSFNMPPHGVAIIKFKM